MVIEWARALNSSGSVGKMSQKQGFESCCVNKTKIRLVLYNYIYYIYTPMFVNKESLLKIFMIIWDGTLALSNRSGVHKVYTEIIVLLWPLVKIILILAWIVHSNTLLIRLCNRLVVQNTINSYVNFLFSTIYLYFMSMSCIVIWYLVIRRIQFYNNFLYSFSNENRI